MKKICLLVIVLAAFSACRKDNSTFLNASKNTSSTNGDKCLIVVSKDLNSGEQGVITYQLDSIPESSIYSKNIRESEYLIKESPTVFLFSLGSKELKDVKYRVYLNSLGAVEKEVKVVLNSDNKTFREVPTESNKYYYNSKNQLIKMYRGLDPTDVSFFEITYDTNNRVNKILVYDEEGGSLYATYNNFKFSTQKKKDNLTQVGFDDSVGVNFIPSLRNVYITHYETFFDGVSSSPDTYDFDLRFVNGSLSGVKTSFVVFGFTVSQDVSITLSCK